MSSPTPTRQHPHKKPSVKQQAQPAAPAPPHSQQAASGVSQLEDSHQQEAIRKQAFAFLERLGLSVFTSTQLEPFARITVDAHHELWPLYSDTFRRWLELKLFAMSGHFPNSAAIKSVLRQLEGIALFLGETQPVYLRVAQHDGKLYLDLCNDRWQIVEVSPTGWQVLDESPIAFRRSQGMQPLPTPTTGGKVEQLLRFVNAGTRDQHLLLLAWVVMAFRPTGPYPILAIKGAQGSAKSSCLRILRSLIDPSDSPIRTTPRDERDLMISAKHAYLVAFDNLSSIPTWLSDAFCRLATGGGLATRRLYTDQDQMIFQASRPILINGIEELAERGDLLDRIVSLRLPPIPKDQRRKESELWTEFEAEQPQILGALLTVLSAVLQRIDTVRIPDPPRMADFAAWATAAEEALGFKAGEALAAYRRNRRESSLHALESSPAITEVIQLVKKVGVWEGTHADLLAQVNQIVGDGKKDSQWPKGGRGMQAAIARAETNLTVAGVKFRRLKRDGGTGLRRIRLETLSPPSPPSQSVTV